MKWLVAGVLILVNVWWLQWEWWTFVGALLILHGIGKLVHQCTCGSCGSCETKDAPAKKKK